MKQKTKLVWIAVLLNVVVLITSFKIIRNETTPNPVIHFEIGCKDIAKTTEFYKSLFGWTPTNVGMSSFINTNSPEGIQGHLNSLGHEPYNYVTVYIQVDNIEDYLKKIQSAGGQKIVGP